MTMSPKRIWKRYMLPFGLVTVLVIVYWIGSKQNKQTGINLNLRRTNEWISRIIYDAESHIEEAETMTDYSPDLTSEIKEGKQTDQFVVEYPPALTSKIKERKQTDVFVVEEHHEVVPYWFSAAEKGVIPKSGNTLIHFDGHIDLAPVKNIPGYPFFKWPTVGQLQYLMQSNDGFIHSSAMTGLVSRLIWVWPDWDRENHSDGYSKDTISLGWAYITDNDDPREKAFCMCANTQDGAQCISLTNIDGKQGEQEEGEFHVPSDKCHIKKSLLVEEVEEKQALSYIGKKDWITASESVILDIDEDYYGCTYAVEPLLKVNMSMAMVDRINRKIGDFLCPVTIIQEKESETILLDIIKLIRMQKVCLSNPNSHNSKKCSRNILKTAVSKTFVQLINTAEEQNKIILCSHRKLDVSEFVKNMAIYLNQMNSQQLHALETVGFCSSTSSKTMDLSDDRRFQLCIGHNTPKDTAVTEHNPTPLEVKQRSVLLKSIFNDLKNNSPKLVTVCRSVRDGYTPRHFFEQIETDILTALTMFNKNVKVHYDDGLLGGKPGWPHGHNNGTY